MKLAGQTAACSAIEEAAHSTEDRAIFFLDLGRAFDSFHAHQEAAGAYKKSIALNPGIGDSHNELAWCQTEYLDGDLKKSAAHAQLAVDLAADKQAESVALDTLGWIWFKRGQLYQAHRLLKRALEISKFDLFPRTHMRIVDSALSSSK